FYCAESCACKGCFNRPDYEDTVLEVRQQNESKNLEAFAPKVVQSVTNSLANGVEVGNCVPLPSLKHKRGCNCKKLMCRKKYCECYELMLVVLMVVDVRIVEMSLARRKEASNWLGDLRYDVGVAFIMLVQM
ncbi:hypothetical protein Ancab_002434, partial [Ancistrocladus abbreviatus]